MSRDAAFVTNVFSVGGTITRNVSRDTARVTGVGIATGDGAIRRANGDFDATVANVLSIHRRDGLFSVA